MARCLSIEDFSVQEQNGRCVVTLEAWDSDANEAFANILSACFPKCDFRLAQSTTQAGFLGLQHSTQVIGKLPEGGVAQVTDLLTLVTKSLTIEDNLDESHALAHHQDQDEGTGKLIRSKLGSLVNEAKYNTSRAPREKLGNAVIEFILAHPRYSSSNVIASIPPHEAATKSSLPGRIVTQVAEALGLTRVEIKRAKETPPQKEITDDDRAVGVRKRIANQKNSMRVDEDLSGLSIIVIDDLYGSGGSMQEAARAARAAGATQVLGLSLTKQRLFEGVRLTTKN